MDVNISANSTPLKVALIGNPNTGKSTLFNALSGGKARIGNYPGVTVEKKTAMVSGGSRPILLIDLPGTYSLAPRSLDEMVCVDVLLGRASDIGRPDCVVCIVDASSLERNLYLVTQVLDLGLPTVVVLNMWDIACERGIQIDVELLQHRLGVAVVTASAHRKIGISKVREALERNPKSPSELPAASFPAAFQQEAASLKSLLEDQGGSKPEPFLVERLLLDAGGYMERELSGPDGEKIRGHLAKARERLSREGSPVPKLEVKTRYDWIRERLQDVVHQPQGRVRTWSDQVDRWLTHWLAGNLVFVCVMLLVFRSIFSWSAPLQEGIEHIQSICADQVAAVLPPGALRSLVNDGVIAGVGGVLVFLPQIMILFFFISLLEDCGYMARAAFLMDKMMTKIGMGGKSFVPLMSSFACAIPGVMAARVIENRRDRMVTILVAPLMSCSARLPVYTLMIGAFVPAVGYFHGMLSLQTLVLLGMVSLGALIAIPTAWVLRSTLFRGEPSSFVMELPSYKRPSLQIVFHRVIEQAKTFVTNAGTLIFATSILVWCLGYFPGNHSTADRLEGELATIVDSEVEESIVAEKREILNREQARLLESSFLGRLGRGIEPVVRPLGWDWRIGVGVLASFPAREVIVATLGTIYSLGGDVDETNEGLREALIRSQRADGKRVFSLPVACSIMVFFALCAQCASTLMVIRREAGHWGWSVFAFSYMTALAYLGSMATFQLGTILWGTN